AYFFAPDGSLGIQAVDAGRNKLFLVMFATKTAQPVPRAVVTDHNNASFALSGDGHTLVWVRDAAERPAEVWMEDLGRMNNTARAVTHENDALVAQLAVSPVEDF